MRIFIVMLIGLFLLSSCGGFSMPPESQRQSQIRQAERLSEDDFNEFMLRQWQELERESRKMLEGMQ